MPDLTAERPRGDGGYLAQLLDTHSGLEWSVDFFRPAHTAYFFARPFDKASHLTKFKESFSKTRTLIKRRPLSLSEEDWDQLYAYSFKASMAMPEFSSEATRRSAGLLNTQPQFMGPVVRFFAEVLQRGQDPVLDKASIMPEFRALVPRMFADPAINNLSLDELDWDELYASSWDWSGSIARHYANRTLQVPPHATLAHDPSPEVLDDSSADHRGPLDHPMPPAAAVLSYTRHFSQEEHRLLQQGLLPYGEEEKWCSRFAEGKLTFHRLWTGYCIYELTISPTAGGFDVALALANRDASQYISPGDAVDLHGVSWLVTELLERARRNPRRG